MNSGTIRTLVATVALAFATAGVHAGSVSWDMPNEYPATSLQGETDQFFSRRLAELSDGDITITHHFGGALGFRSRDQLDAVGDGAVPLANTFIAPLGGMDPLFLLMSLPFLTSDPQEAKRLFDVAEPHFNTVLERYNQRLLYSSPWASSGLWSRKELADSQSFAGLKMRTYDANSTEVFRTAGASPVQLSWADIVPQLSAGGIDGVLTSIEAGLSASFNEYTPHFAAINYDSTVNLATINLDVWNGLDDAQRALVQQAADETAAHAWANIADAVAQSYEQGEAKGMTIQREVDPAFRQQMADNAQPVIDAWLKQVGESGVQILDAYRQGTSGAESN
ncbi:TRAP-type C4-dicarboxylate transport system, substrate-binding protein [Paracoccus alkenifer]|uniref:TRAP-type C4-dicarboxylate transport system, substrate-binding protein n=2 Tax=Paracoccus alkenifer TaxID=65735 RepID=A0A1H6LUG9_9RHOB|nr:TRAP-type C4-dicarboxylate transport system, substrate-binding protein [Paracoccus alkenifer]